MAHINSDIKLGFFPTDTKALREVLKKIITKGQKPFSVIDPCCGEGEAISIFKDFNASRLFGVELDEQRAIKASNCIDKVLVADALYVSKSKEFFGFLFLNSPYGDIVQRSIFTSKSETKRLEIEFVKKWTPSVVKNGLMLLLINPSSCNEEMVKNLKGWSVLKNFFFDNSDHKKFKQYFLLLIKDGGNTTLGEIDIKKSIPFHEANLLNIEIPADSLRKPIFKAAEGLKAWQKAKIIAKNSIRERIIKKISTYETTETISIASPNEGQSALLLTAGACNESINGFLIKGKFKKAEVVSENVNGSTIVQEEFVSDVYAFDTKLGKYYKLT